MSTRARQAFTVALATLALPASAAAQGRVGVIDTSTNTVISDITVGIEPGSIAITPNGARVYVTNGPDDGDISVINTATNTLAGPDIAVGGSPTSIAITPNGSRAYVPTFVDGTSDFIRVIDLATHTIVANVPVGNRQPNAVAFTPDGSRAYATNAVGDSVSVIDTATNTITQDIAVGSWPVTIAITPDGTRAYVGDTIDAEVSVIDIATNTLAAPNIAVGDSPEAIAITPNGTRAYVANMAGGSGGGSVSVINTATNALAGPDFAVGLNPSGVAISPNGARAYFSNLHGGSVSVVNTATNTAVGPEIAVGSLARDIVIRPDGARVYVAKEGAAPTPPPGPGPGALPPPVAGKSVNVRAAKGVVRVKCPGERKFTTLGAARQIPVGCLVDTRRGTVLLTSAGRGASTQSARFWKGLFRVTQKAGSNPFTELALAGGLGCRAGGRAAARKRGPGRKLWGDGKGRFKVKGQRGAATVRGTRWLVADRCDRTTLFRVTQGVIQVRDFTRRRTVTVRRGKSYVAPGPRG